MKISIITATYNCAHLIEECLGSVAEQTAIDKIEHIIIDGGSTDKTLATISKYPHVAKIFSAPDRGIYHAFNRGVDLASGDIIFFLGADDSLYETGVIKTILDAFGSEDIDYAVTKVRCFDEESGEVWFANTEVLNRANTCHQGFFCKSSLFNKIGPFSECFKLYADSFFMKTAIARYQGTYIDAISANFRQGGASSSSASRLLLKREADAVAQLIGETTSSKEIQLDKNVIDLKLLLEKVLNQEKLLASYSGMKVGVFGTRQLSILIADALRQNGALVSCFLQSTRDSINEIMDVPVKSIEEARDLSLSMVINGVEGEHELDISEVLRDKLEGTKVISWRDM